jgi:RNA polymerase sigma-70 factor (ECF subfamily)
LSALCQDNTVALCNPGASPREAFEAIVKRHMKDAYLIALGLVGNREDALELSQEAFYRAYKHYDQLNAKGKFFPWFYQILRNLCFSHLRHRRVCRNYQLRTADCGLRTGDSDPNPQSAIPNPQSPEMADQFDPEVVAERNETKDRIWRAISRLDDKHREVIILRHFQNLSYEEMAKLLFCNQGTVTSRLFYARQRLKEILDHERGSPDVQGSPDALSHGWEPPSDVGGARKGGQTS